MVDLQLGSDEESSLPTKASRIMLTIQALFNILKVRHSILREMLRVTLPQDQGFFGLTIRQARTLL